MSPEQARLTVVRNEIAARPKAQQEAVAAASRQIVAIVEQYRESGLLALALLGAELAAQG